MSIESFRLSIHLLALFALFRGVSFGLEVFVRGERPGFFVTMEYFLAPAFWLSPMHANSLVFTRMSAVPKPELSLRPLFWIFRGLLTALVFSFVYKWGAGWLGEVYKGGLANWAWWYFFAAGALVFIFSYLEKSRVSYLSAGFLRLSGHDVSPDFNAPWLATDLLDYWRRFHYWVLEFYRDNFYGPLSVELSRRVSAKAAVALALFLTFFVATTLSHYIWYPGPFLPTLILGFLFGIFTLAHLWLRPWLQAKCISIPFTWLSVMFLYLLAYPVFGLGWNLMELRSFFSL